MKNVNTPKSIPEIKQEDIARFWSKVAITANDNKCWNWLGSKRRRGYGRFSISHNKKEASYTSTRFSYFINFKINPTEEQIVLHTCDNPECVNPKHLKLGTNKDNAVDMMQKGRGVKQFVNGSAHKMSKLKEDDIPLIRKMIKEKISFDVIGEKFGVSKWTIMNIKIGRNWSHVPIFKELIN